MAYQLPRIDQHELAAACLPVIARFGWLRATELGRLMFRENPHGRKYAEKLIRKLVTLKLVIPRPLPGRGAGFAYVLSSQGAAQLNQWYSGGYTSGKDWGSTDGGVWRPPASWRHDLIAIGVLSHLAAEGFEVYPERFLRWHAPDARKHPDGLITDHEHKCSYWLEVEHSRKSGANLRALAEALILAYRRSPVVNYEFVQHAPIAMGVVAIDPDARDERGYKLDHWGHIATAIRNTPIKAEVQVEVIWIKLVGVGVGAIRIETKTITP